MLVLLDGLGDRAYDEFDGKTPLQAAHTPFLDRLAAMGANGLFHAGVQGEALPSENAHFAMFGYDPDSFPGRGPLEALGAGIDLDYEDVAVLAHFASVQEKGEALFLMNNNPGADPREALEVAQTAASFSHNGIALNFTLTHKLNGIVTLKGLVSPYFTDTDPMMAQRPLIAPLPLEGWESDAATQNAVEALYQYLRNIYRSLKQHPVNKSRAANGRDPVNALITQRAGRLRPAEPFSSKYGLKGLLMASGLVYHGLGRFLGLECLKTTDTQNPGLDLALRIKKAHELAADYDFIHVHTKVPDEAGHTKDPVRKKKMIEALDAGLSDALPPVLQDPDMLVVVTADHSTPSSGPLIHSGETVPLMFCGPGVRCDAVRQYDEVSAARGALGQVRGRELMLMILNALDRAKLQGLRDTPRDQPFWPGNRVPFTFR